MTNKEYKLIEEFALNITPAHEKISESQRSWNDCVVTLQSNIAQKLQELKNKIEDEPRIKRVTNTSSSFDDVKF